MNLIIRFFLNIWCIFLLLCPFKTLSQSLTVSRAEQLEWVSSLIETLRTTNIYNRTVVALVNDSVKIDRKGFEKEVFGGGLGGNASKDVASIQIRSNIFAYMLSGNQWTMVRESSDSCVYLLDTKFYSTTNLSEMPPAELDRLKEIYWERLAFDPTRRYGYKWASYGPYQSSVLTSAEATPPKTFNLKFAGSIEQEMVFMILAALGQTNILSRQICNPLFYDFNGVQYDLKSVQKALDSGRVHISKNPIDPAVRISFEAPFNMVVHLSYHKGSAVPFGRIELQENGVTVRRITRSLIVGKPWSLEWFDEQFDSRKELVRFSKRYILSESAANVEELFAAFDDVQKKSELRSHQNSDGSFEDFKSGIKSQRSAASIGSKEFLRDNGRWFFVVVFASVSLGFGWLLLRRR